MGSWGWQVCIGPSLPQPHVAPGLDTYKLCLLLFALTEPASQQPFCSIPQTFLMLGSKSGGAGNAEQHTVPALQELAAWWGRSSPLSRLRPALSSSVRPTTPQPCFRGEATNCPQSRAQTATLFPGLPVPPVSNLLSRTLTRRVSCSEHCPSGCNHHLFFAPAVCLNQRIVRTPKHSTPGCFRDQSGCAQDAGQTGSPPPPHLLTSAGTKNTKIP